MTISRTTKRAVLAERPQRRRSGLKAAPASVLPRLGRRAPTADRAAAGAGGAAAQASNVRVVVRVRPENERERQGNHRLVVRPLDDFMLIFDPRQENEDFYFQGVRQRQRDLNKRASKDMQYMFDRVFHPHHTNQQLFEATTKDVIDTVLDGFNCSVFAYGSTGAGKTHTMLGNSGEPGIIFLTVMELYSRIEALADIQCQVSVSYVEVYNETVTDLLHPSGPLDVREDGQRSVVINGLSQETPNGPDHLMTILEAGNKNRTQHPTDMNAESSRSHAVFQVLLRQSDSTVSLSTDVRVSKLSLIDLAGSERGTATGHKGARFREGANINRSLLALGSCINALADGKKFVPYRDSKLTRLLKDSIGGNCKTVMIANVTPSAASFEDTHNTLKYADRAKAIKTRLQRNVVSINMHVAQYAKVVDELRQEVADLKAQLAERPAAAEHPPAAVVAAPEQPPFDPTPLRSAEAARRELLTRQLQLQAEAHQLRLRLHRRRLCAQRTALLRPAGAARPDRLAERLAGRLSQAHSRLERARQELVATEQEAQRQAAAAPPGPATDQLTVQLETERHLDECRVHAAHLEAFSRLQQLELAASDHLLTQLITAFREQYRVLSFIKFVTPELEAQYKEIVGLVEGQKEVCWADQQQPAADSPGQPSYDVTALLRLADTSYLPAEPTRHVITGLLRTASRPAAGPDPAAHTSVSDGDVTLASLSAVLPPSDTTLGCGDTGEALIAVPVPAQVAPPSSGATRPPSDRDGGGCPPRPASPGPPEASPPSPEPASAPGGTDVSRAAYDAELSPGVGGLEADTSQGLSSERPDSPAVDAAWSPVSRETGEALVSPHGTGRDAGDPDPTGPDCIAHNPRTTPAGTGEPDSSEPTVTAVGPPAARNSASPDLNAKATVSSSERSSASPSLDTTVTLDSHASAPPDLNATVTLLPTAEVGVDLNATQTLSSAGADCAPLSSGVLPSFDSSPIRPHPAVAAAVALPDLPPTPEILRRTRTPLKTRTPAAGIDCTFTVRPPSFRSSATATADGGGGGTTAGDGGHRAVAGRSAPQRGGLSRSASAVHMSQTARGRDRGSSGPRRFREPTAPPSGATPGSARLPLSAQKARSVSCLHPGGRDENHQPERHSWGRATAPAPLPSTGTSKATGRQGPASASKSVLGRNRMMAKSRSAAVLKPANV